MVFFIYIFFYFYTFRLFVIGVFSLEEDTPVFCIESNAIFDPKYTSAWYSLQELFQSSLTCKRKVSINLQRVIS